MKRLFISNPNNEGLGINEMCRIYNNTRLLVQTKFGEPVLLQNIPHVMVTDQDIIPTMACRLMELSCSDIAYFAAGWDLYLSSRFEHECAVKAGIPILEERDLAGITL